MWAIQLYDKRPGTVYLREYALDGRILVFEEEEMALRLMRQIRSDMEKALGVEVKTVRYTNDPRQDKPCKVPGTKLDIYAESLLSMVGN